MEFEIINEYINSHYNKKFTFDDIKKLFSNLEEILNMYDIKVSE